MLRDLAYLIYTTVKSLHATLPSHHPFPPELSKNRLPHQQSHRDQESQIQQTNQTQQLLHAPHWPDTTPPCGIVISKDSQYGDLLNNAIKHVCITNNTSLPIFGRSDHLCISLHALRSSTDKNHTIARQIDINHHTLHDPSQYMILRHIRINSKIISKYYLYLRRAIGSFGNCIGLLLNFANRPVDLQLTGIFQASRETSFLSPNKPHPKSSKPTKTPST